MSIEILLSVHFPIPFFLCNLLLISKELEVAQHLLVRNEKIGFALVRDAIFQASLLNDVLDVYIVGVADAREQMVLDLMRQATTEVVPEVRARTPVDAGLALDGRPIIVGYVLHLAASRSLLRIGPCLFHGGAARYGGGTEFNIALQAQRLSLLAERYALDHVIHNKHRRKEFTTCKMAKAKESHTTSNAVEIARQNNHVAHRQYLHRPEAQNIEDGPISALGINVIQTLARRNLNVLLEHLGQGHECKEQGCIQVLVAMVPLGGVVGVHPHGRERREDVGIGLLVLVAHGTVFAGLLPLLFVNVEDIREGMMTEHVLDFPRVSRRTDHIERPTGHLVQSTVGGEGTMIAIVLDARADEGGEYPHRHGPKGSNPKRLSHVHVVQGEPESHQQEDGLDPDLVSTSAGQIALLQSLHHAVAQGLVEIGIPGVEARLDFPFLHGSDLQLVQEGRGDATGMVRLKQNRGILASGQEDDVSAGMALGKVGDVNHTAVDGGPGVLRDVVRSQFVARDETISVDDLVLEGCIADRGSRRGAASWSLAHAC